MLRKSTALLIIMVLIFSGFILSEEKKLDLPTQKNLMELGAELARGIIALQTEKPPESLETSLKYVRILLGKLGKVKEAKESRVLLMALKKQLLDKKKTAKVKDVLVNYEKLKAEMQKLTESVYEKEGNWYFSLGIELTFAYNYAKNKDAESLVKTTKNIKTMLENKPSSLPAKLEELLQKIAETKEPAEITENIGKIPQLYTDLTFVRFFFVSDRGNKFQNIYSMKSDGSDIKQLTNFVYNCYAPVTAKDGRVVFVGYKNRNDDIFIMNSDGTNIKQLTDTFANDTAPSVLPDGRIVFETNRDRNLEIYIMEPDGTNVKNLTRLMKDDYNPAAMPDGRIAFISNRYGFPELFIMESDGTNVRQLTNNRIEKALPWATPDGKVIYQQAVTAKDKSKKQHWEIYKLDPATKELTRLTDSPLDKFRPVVLPTGEILYTSYIGSFKVYIMDADGKNPKCLTETSRELNSTR